MDPVCLSTARLTLSPPVGSDIDAITAAAQDPEVPRWTTLPSPYGRAHAEEFLQKSARGWLDGTELTWAIRHRGAWIGMVGLHAIEQHPVAGGCAELGYWMAAPARGHGYLTEAARAVLDFAFAQDGAGLERVEWRAVVGNVASARAARTLGFRFEGTLRQGLADPRGRHDGWIAGLLARDDRSRQPWPVLAP